MQSHAPHPTTAIQQRPLSRPQAQFFCGTSLITGGPFLLTTLNPRFSASLCTKILLPEPQPLPPRQLLGPGGEVRHTVIEAKLQRAKEMRKLFQRAQDFLGEWMRGNWTPDPEHTGRTLKGWFWLATGTSLTGAGLILSAMLLHK